MEVDGEAMTNQTPLEALREKAIEAYDAAKAEAEKQSKPTTQSSYLSGLSVAYHVALKMWEAALSQPEDGVYVYVDGKRNTAVEIALTASIEQSVSQPANEGSES
jgi:hypothetical protein